MIDTFQYQLTLTPQAGKFPSLTDRKDHRSNLGKKRIGPYHYNLSDCIGSGYSSHVYKGYKNDSKEQVYAIKVIKLAVMNKSNYALLQN